jgi:hypothetical protein
MALFGYPVTRPIKLGKWTLAGVALIAVLYLGIITILNFVAVAYETVQITSDSYNTSQSLWYQHIIPSNWVPPALICNPAVLTLNQGSPT